MASKFFSQLPSVMAQQDCFQDIRDCLKRYSILRHASFAKMYKGAGDQTKQKSPKESRIPLASSKIKRPGKGPLIEIFDKPQETLPSPSNFDSNLARTIGIAAVSSDANHNVLYDPCNNYLVVDCKDDKQKSSLQLSQSRSKPSLASLDNNIFANKDSREPLKCSSQETWLNSHIRKYRTVECDYESGNATTHLIARFSPKGVGKPVPANRYVEIEYKFDRKTNAESFDKKGCLESLLPVPGEDSMESLYDDRVYQPDIDVFLQNFDYFINNLEGIVWWNGYNISASGHRDNRLQIHDFDMEPGRIIISLEKIKEVNIIRDPLRLELRAEDLSGKLKWFRLKGEHISLLKVTGPKDGVFVIEFPEYPLKPKATISRTQ